MLKKYLFIVAAIFAVIGFQSQAFAVPTSELVFTADMTEEQLQAELAKADDIEAAVTAAIVAGASAVDVVKAAISVAPPEKARNIKARAVAASPASEKAAIVMAADKAVLVKAKFLAVKAMGGSDEAAQALADRKESNLENERSQSKIDSEITTMLAVSSIYGTSGLSGYTGGGGGLTSLQIVAEVNSPS